MAANAVVCEAVPDDTYVFPAKFKVVIKEDEDN